ncbi:MAG TPA: RNA polymerase sigma factor region1.1 domain-containing protein, partial [Verrucomicrobiae bacterium]|nr:RNA polymerase sigma factor region1.1 domain-containing protein [Verrucomicrobiae bacterium]
MLKRKVTTPKSASRSGSRSAKPVKPAKAKSAPAPVRRRFVISSKAIKPEALKTKPVVAPETPAKASAKTPVKTPANGSAAPTAPTQSTVDLSETIKTLLHLSQEHGYITYDDINDILPDNLSPDDLDALLTKLRSLDVEIVMDQAEAERAERTKQPEAQEEAVDEDAR